MKVRSLVIGCVAVLVWVLAINAQSARPEPAASPAAVPAAAQPARPQPAAAPGEVRQIAATTTPAVSVDQQRAFMKTWCVGCHNQAAAKAGIDSSRKLQIDT